MDEPAELETKKEAKRALLSETVEIEAGKLRKNKENQLADCFWFVSEPYNSLTGKATKMCATSHCKV